MTEIQKEQAKKLRMQGFGYKKIAAVLQLLPNTVKSYCQREGLSGVMAKPRSEIIDGHFCKNCGLPVLQDEKKEKKICSYECRMEWWKKKCYKWIGFGVAPEKKFFSGVFFYVTLPSVCFGVSLKPYGT